MRKTAFQRLTVQAFAKLFLFCGVLLLGACGFSPIYGSHDNNLSVDRSLSHVEISNISDRRGQQLRNHLIDRMYFEGRPEHPDAKLSVVMRSTVSDFGIQKDATTARSQLNLWADYTLSSLDGKELMKGSAHSVVSFSKLSAQYGTLAAEQNAYDRAIREVGEQIVNRVSLFYAERS